MATVQTTTNASSVYSEYILRKLIPGLKARLLFADYAEPAILPGGAGAITARWVIPTMTAGATTALNETAPWQGEISQAAFTPVTATIHKKGEFYPISDLHKDTVLSGMLDAYREQMEYAGAGAIDASIQEELLKTTQFLHSAALSQIDSVTLATTDQGTVRDFTRGAELLRTNNVQGFDSLSGDFVFAVHPHYEGGLVTEAESSGSVTWAKVHQQTPAGFQKLVDNDRLVGRFNNVTALRTSQIGTLVEDVTAYQNIMWGRYAVGWLGLDEKGPKRPKVQMKSPGPNDTYQPLDTFHTLGWTVRAVQQLLAANRCLVVYSST